MNSLNGQYHYRSFCPQAGTKDTAPELAAPWAPPGKLTAQTDASGKVTATLSFGPGRDLAVTGAITPAAGNAPEGIQLTGEGLGATYKIRGYFLEGSNHLTGTVAAVANDVARQPIGTRGPFVLFPV